MWGRGPRRRRCSTRCSRPPPTRWSRCSCKASSSSTWARPRRRSSSSPRSSSAIPGRWAPVSGWRSSSARGASSPRPPPTWRRSPRSGRTCTIVHFELGRTLLMQRQLDPALRAFERAEQTSPDPAVARVRSAMVLAAAGERDRAIAKAQASVASVNAAPLAYSLLARLHLEKGSPELAERELQSGVKAAPQSVTARMQLARFYIGQRRPAEAIAPLQEAVKLAPERAGSRWAFSSTPTSPTGSPTWRSPAPSASGRSRATPPPPISSTAWRTRRWDGRSPPSRPISGRSRRSPTTSSSCARARASSSGSSAVPRPGACSRRRPSRARRRSSRSSISPSWKSGPAIARVPSPPTGGRSRGRPRTPGSSTTSPTSSPTIPRHGTRR